MTKRMQRKLDAAYEKTYRTVGLHGFDFSEDFKWNLRTMFEVGFKTALEMTKPKE